METLRSKALCFGGPMDGRIVRDSGAVLLANTLPKAASYIQWEPTSVPGAHIRCVTYDRHRLAHPRMGDLGTVYVADGYPMHRITDQLNAIVGLCRLACGSVHWGPTPVR